MISRIRSAFGVDLPLRTLFEMPTVARLAHRIGEARASANIGQVPEILRQDRREGLPLSFAQQRLWFLDQLEPGGWTYNIPLALRIEGGLDPAVLQAALRELVRRHESLRTVFAAVEGEPFQDIRPAGDPPLPQLDLAGLAPEARQRELRRLSRLEARRAFDLGRDPMLRALLVHLGETEHALLLTMHHIASDGWSMDILWRELRALYEAGRSGRPSPLPELPIQYSDFAFWQRSWLAGEVLAAEIDHWRERLSGAPHILELPTDRPRPAVQGSAGRVERLRLDEDLAEALRALSRQQGVTLFMVLLSAWQTFLSRLTGQEDVSVGTPIAGRNRLELEGLIGFFVNTLVLRCDLSGDPGFGELLHRAREVVLDAQAHQDLPFEKLVEELKPERSLAHSPLFQVSLLLQQASRDGSLGLSGLHTSRLEVGDLDAAKFDLTLGVEERRGGGLVLALSYRTELFDPPSARRMLRQIEVQLGTLAADPRRRISELQLLAAPELHQLLREWNDSREKFPGERCIHELFEEQVGLSPNSVAVAFEDKSLTYRELDTRANRLAWVLRGLGVMPEVRVAICVERSLEMMVGLLAILKAGGAYVPLDPEYPQDRLAYMIEDCGAPVLLTQRRLASILTHSAHTLWLDEDEHSNTPERFGPPPQLTDPDHLMYVIYTSGSTGRPKGVMVRHRGIMNRLAWAQRAYPVTAFDRVLQKASFSFDFSVWECFAPLLTGACVVLARPGGHRDSAYLVETIREERITLVHFVPSMLQAFLDEEQIETCRNLRFVFSGGEALTTELRDRFFSRAAVPLRNQYGPTEISIDVTEWVCHSPGQRSVPIGRPLANGVTYVLDPRLWPVPIGVPGELFLGGEGLARGYLGRPELTAERFMPDPFGGEPGGRIYRTGDLARHVPDGNLEFLGRVDHQVKVRGFRIELGEIESTLRRYPEIHDAVVSVLDSPSGGKRLVAYVVPQTGSLVRGSELREFLGRFLPSFMVPPFYVVVESLSYLPNGKIDRRVLPAPEQRGEGEGSVAPRTPEEEILVGIWAEVLGREQVGVTDSFFELGGHSLLATQVISRIRSAFAVDLPLRTLFETPTVARLARRIGEARFSANVGQMPGQVPEIQRQDRREGLPLSFAQQRLWFLDQLEPAGWTYNIPLALHIEGGLDPAVLQAALRELVRRHESLRTVFAAIEGEPFQDIRPAGDPPLPQLDLAGLAPEARQRELGRLVRLEARRAFDLGRDPMLRVLLVHLGKEEHALLLTVHHIASDGWSMDILWRELGALYEAGRSGRPSPLPELPIQYPDFASWQRSWLTGAVLAAEIDHWRERLAGAPHLLELPTDRPRPAVQGSAGRAERLRLGEDLAETLRSLSRRQGVTLFMVLLSAWQALLGRLTGQQDVSVGTPVAGRSRLEIEGLIGFFVNTLVLRCDLSGDPGMSEMLRRVREVVLDAHAHQDLPFEKLVEEIKPERSLANSPLFQVMLVLQNAGQAGSAGLSGLQTGRLGTTDEMEAAKFDLTLGVEERRGGGLGLALSYRTELFDAPSVRRMLRHLEALLGSLASDPQRRISELPVLTQPERAQLLVEWNDTGRPGSEEPRCLQELFAAQAARSPEAVAVVDGEREISYGELDRWSNRLANHLRELGVGPEVPVAICLERSTRMIAAILGVLKAAGAYVPLDPAYPAERLRLMLEDSAAPVIVTESALAEVVPATAGRYVLMDGELLDRQSAAAPDGRACPDNLAYVIYTSGSTGRPKGVAIAHRSASALLHWAQEVYAAQQIAGVLAATSICFDLSIFEIFVPLTRGGAVILAANALALPELPAARRVTLVNTVPSAIAELVRSGGIPSSVVTVNLAGEPLPPPLVEQIQGLGTVREVYNLYGPSEDTTYSTWARMDPEPGALCPIGRPISGTRSHVLDPRGGLAPIGSPGELFLGGEGLARGYLGRPDLTAERFVPDPFGPPGARLYRTGDLARHLPDGRLGFLGRADHQVKVRGFRIELGEIETALRRHGAVDQTVVLAREDRSGDQRLVAYAVLHEGASAGEAELRSHLRQTLPEYMVPSAFVLLDSLPLTPNGKIDRRALPAPEQRGEEEDSMAPRDAVELELQRIWEEVLGVASVGIGDSFFDLGGHSLLAIKLITRIRRRFGRDLPLAALFRADTVERFALLLRQAAPPRSSSLVEISIGTGAEALFFVHPGAGDVFGYVPLARRLAPWRFYGLQAPGIEGEGEPLASVEDLAAIHLSAVRSVQPAGPYRIGGWSMGGLVALEMARRLENEGERVGLVALLDTRVPAAAAPGPEDDLRLLAAFAQEIGVRSDLLQLSPEEVAGLAPDHRLSWILEKAWAERLLPPDMDLQLLERRLAVFRANVQAMQRHQVRPYRGNVVLFTPEQAPPEAPEAWKETLPQLQIEPVGGTHFSLVREPYVNLLAERMKVHLREAPGASIS
ncbi:MAG TPA: amino acid adenylation domain-containing protein [Thermoanaerobaculia bacterium]|nr:amino acid adenylation domain-containing protein [Thermoanaerobaculia bacterium]